MSKKNSKKKEQEKDIRKLTMVHLFVLGIVVIFATALLQSFLPNFPALVRNILYFVGIAALVVYMIQIAFEKRTGKSESDGESRPNRLRNRK